MTIDAQLKMRNREERDTFMLFLQYYVRESKKRSSSSLDLSIVSFKKKGSKYHHYLRYTKNRSCR